MVRWSVPTGSFPANRLFRRNEEPNRRLTMVVMSVGHCIPSALKYPSIR
jgi:hypothetical protein